MALFPTNAAQVQTFATALYGVQVGTTTMAQVTADIASAGGLNNALNGYYTASFGTATTASVAQTIATNVGLGSDTNAVAFITAQLNAAAPAARGAAVIAMLDNFLNTTTGTYAAAAAAFNTTVTTAVAYTGAANAAPGTVVVAAPATFTLTSGLDNLSGGSSANTFLGTFTGVSTAGDTINLGDSIVGGAGSNTFKAYIGAGATTGITFPSISMSGVTNFVAIDSSGQTLTVSATNSLSGVTSITGTETAAAATFDSMSPSVVYTQQGQGYGGVTLGYNGLSSTSTVSLVANGAYGTGTTAAETFTLQKGTGAATADVAPYLLSVTGTGGLMTFSDASLTTITASVSGTSTISATGTTAPALKVINLSGSTGSVTTDLTSQTTNATLSATSFAFSGSAGNDTLRLNINVSTTATSSQLDNFSSTTYSIDGGAGTNTLTLYASPVTAGAAVTLVESSSGFAENGKTADATLLTAVNAIKNFTTLRLNQYDTTATAATTNVELAP